MSQTLNSCYGRILLGFSLILIFSPCARAGELSTSQFHRQQGHIRLSFESVDMPSPDDRMGLLGFSYLMDVTPAWYLGIGGYGSVSGDRGGFFTGGFSGGIKQHLARKLWVDTGLFIGGGGGGGAAQGGGLMLRPHAGVGYDFDSFQVGVAFSLIDFPNGEIDSEQLAVTLDIPFNSFRASNPLLAPRISPADIADADVKDFGAIHQEFLIKNRNYYLDNSARATTGEPANRRLNLIGVELRRFFSRQGFLLAEAMGAFGGDSDGYAEVLFGAGYRLPLTPSGRLGVLGSLAAGGAGGGRVDTGGGAVVRAETDLEFQLSRSTFSALSGGYIDAVDGTTSAWVLGLKIGTTFDNIGTGTGRTPLTAEEALDWSQWRFRSSHISYFEPERSHTLSMGQDIHLFGVKIDHFLSEALYLTGQAAGAYRGEAGGYAVGLIGFGGQSPLPGIDDWSVIGELLAGAGGGGGIAVGQGALLQPQLGIGYTLNQHFNLQAMLGQAIAIDGDLNTTTAELSLCYRFASLVRTRTKRSN